jgi:hypothetical protein
MIGQLGAAIWCFTADGAYDTRAIYEALAASGAAEPNIVIPPKRTARIDLRSAELWCQRNEAIKRIAKVGRRQWRKESGAHQQARADNGMFRYKRNIGAALRARKFETQKREAKIAVNVINRMTELGMPQSVAVVA